MSKFYKDNKQEVDNRYKIFKSKVNMSYKEMIAWKKQPCSRAASIKVDEVINRVTRLLKKPKYTWTEKDFSDSTKVISYISRASAIKDSLKPATKNCRKGKNFYALRNWAYDREKEKRQNRRKGLHKNPARPNPYEIPLLETIVFIDNFKQKISQLDQHALEHFNYSYINDFLDITWHEHLKYTDYIKKLISNWLSAIVQTKINRHYRMGGLGIKQGMGNIKKELDFKILFNKFISDVQIEYGKFNSVYFNADGIIN